MKETALPSGHATRWTRTPPFPGLLRLFTSRPLYQHVLKAIQIPNSGEFLLVEALVSNIQPIRYSESH